MNTQILLFASSCFARCDLYSRPVPVWLHKRVAGVEPAQCVSRNNDDKVKQLAGISSNALLQAWVGWFACLSPANGVSGVC